MKRTLSALALLAAVSAPALADEAAIEQKLNLLIEQQGKVLQALEEVKSELQVVKVRATR